MVGVKYPLTKELVLDFLKRHPKKKYTVNYLTTEMKREHGETHSIHYNNVDKWIEVLLIRNEIRHDNVAGRKIIWWQDDG